MEGKNGQTEKATARRREKEREKGNLPLSQEVLSVSVLLVATLLLRMSFPSYFVGARHMMERSRLDIATGPHWSGPWLQTMYWQGLNAVLVVLAPLLGGIMLTGVVATMGQVGPYFSWGAFQSGGLKALNPVKGAKKLFSVKSIVTLFMTLGKIMIISTVIYLFWRRRWIVLAQLPELELTPVIAWVGRNIFATVILVVLCAIVIAAIDVVITRRRNERGMMMTKQEVKDEHKQTEVPATVKRKQAQKMREMSMSRMIAAVPEATVVVTNPTRVAVALKYDPAKMDAPVVVAKGLRLHAARIRELAAAHGVPLVERPPLARALYKSAQVGRPIPTALFEGVAEVLAYLHRMNRQVQNLSGRQGARVA